VEAMFDEISEKIRNSTYKDVEIKKIIKKENVRMLLFIFTFQNRVDFEISVINYSEYSSISVIHNIPEEFSKILSIVIEIKKDIITCIREMEKYRLPILFNQIKISST
jgi:hypothetical protein